MGALLAMMFLMSQFDLPKKKPKNDKIGPFVCGAITATAVTLTVFIWVL